MASDGATIATASLRICAADIGRHCVSDSSCKRRARRFQLDRLRSFCFRRSKTHSCKFCDEIVDAPDRRGNPMSQLMKTSTVPTAFRTGDDMWQRIATCGPGCGFCGSLQNRDSLTICARCSAAVSSTASIRWGPGNLFVSTSALTAQWRRCAQRPREAPCSNRSSSCEDVFVGAFAACSCAARGCCVQPPLPRPRSS